MRATQGRTLTWAVALMIGPSVAVHAQSTEEARLTIRVVDGAANIPLAGVVVQLSRIGLRVVTDARGEVSFDAPRGTYLLVARKPGYEALEGDFEVRRPGGITLRMVAAEFGDPSAPGALRGTVTDGETGRPIEGAEIASLGAGSTITDQRGRFAFDEVPMGLMDIRVRMLGYAERAESIAIEAGRTSVVQMDMAADPIELEPISVEVRSRFLERRGVYRRMERGVAQRVVTREGIDRLQSPRLSDSLRRAGLNVVRAGKRAVLLGRGRCALRIYLDGIRMQPDIEGSVDIDQIPPDWVELAEVYTGIASVPPEYAEADCGVVLIWTRQRAG